MSLWLLAGCTILSGALSAALLPFLITLGHKYDLIDPPGKHKRHREPTPVLGGIALFVSTWVTILIGWLVVGSGFEELTPVLWYILGGALIIALVGLSDDLSPISALTKLLAQAAAGLVLYLGGLEVQLVTTPFGSIDIGNWSMLITIMWVVGLTNAINLIDGLDGLAGGVSLIAACFLLFIGLLYEIGAVLLFVACLVGFLVPFLYFNHSPARIFLGDSGSMQIGYYFAVFSLSVSLKSYTTAALVVPLLALGVPILEAGSSFIRRLLAGKSVVTADRRHLFHYLALAGLSKGQVVVIFYLLAFIFGCFALAMFYFNRVLVFSVLVLFMVVILALFFIFIVNAPRRRLGNGRRESTSGDL